jgi:hypothetical protein
MDQPAQYTASDRPIQLGAADSGRQAPVGEALAENRGGSSAARAHGAPRVARRVDHGPIANCLGTSGHRPLRLVTAAHS